MSARLAGCGDHVARAVALLALGVTLCSPRGALGMEGLAIESELFPAAPYVQAEATYVVRLYRRSSFLAGYFLQPEIPHAVIEFIDESEPVDVMRDGERWQLIERRYILLPQTSGPLEIPGPVYSGRSAYIKGESTTFHIRPRPDEWDAAWWLPAREVRVTQEWHIPPSPIRTGDRIERTVTLFADGLTGAQLPPLPLPAGDGFDVLRLRAENRHRVEGGHVRGQRVEHHLFVAHRAGTLRVPALNIRWWDTKTDQARSTGLPGRDIAIHLATDGPGVVQPPPTQAISGLGPAGDATLGQRGPSPLLGIGAAAIGVTLLAAWLALAVVKSQRMRARRAQRRTRKRVERCALQGRAHAVRAALLDWARACWTRPPLNLGEMGRRLQDKDAAAALRALDAVLYGGAGHNAGWDGAPFVRCVLPALVGVERRLRRRVSAGRTTLPPLCP